ncbi:hypothetical protein HZA99_06790 [Candidatus Woesearchaeota archaeon]|nr:hypothetical protein [Candidatus Woesearchaeota archaeon]
MLFFVKNKKAQVTLFILIGLLIFLTIGFFTLYTTQQTAISQEDKNMQVSIETYLQNCLEQQLPNILRLVAFQGGYYEAPPYSMTYFFEDEYYLYYPYLSYYYLNYNDLSAATETVQEQISKGILAKEEKCTAIPQNYILTLGTADVETTLRDTTVEATVDLHASFHTDSSTITLSPLHIAEKSNLLKMYDIAKQITENQAQYQDQWCVACISQILNGTDVSLEREEVIRDEEREVIYVLYDNENLSFRFVHGFPYFGEYTQPILYPIKNLTATAGQEFIYTVKAQGINLTYSDTTNLFDIDKKTGVIHFTPKETDVGASIITITATDINNQSAEINTLFFIKEELYAGIVQ